MAETLMQQLEATRSYEEADCIPTERAYNRARLLLESVPFPESSSCVYGDGENGLRCESAQGTRQIRLIVHAEKDNSDYIYWEDDLTHEHAVVAPVTVEVLEQWIKWLRQ